MTSREEARRLPEGTRKAPLSGCQNTRHGPGCVTMAQVRGGQAGSEPRALKYAYSPACGCEEASVSLGSDGATSAVCIIMSCPLSVLLRFSVSPVVSLLGVQVPQGQSNAHSYILSPEHNVWHIVDSLFRFNEWLRAKVFQEGQHFICPAVGLK